MSLKQSTKDMDFVMKAIKNSHPESFVTKNDFNQVVVYDAKGMYIGLVIDFNPDPLRSAKLSRLGFYVCNYKNNKQSRLEISRYYTAFKEKTEYSKKAVDDLIQEIAVLFKIKPGLIKSKRRSRSISLARQFAMYVMRRKFVIYGNPMSLESIGKEFDRHHATVIYAFNLVEDMLDFNPEFKKLTYNYLLAKGLEF